jgi:hypothetical protein
MGPQTQRGVNARHPRDRVRDNLGMKLVAVVCVVGCTYHAGPTIGYRPATKRVAVGFHGGAGYWLVETVAGASFSRGASSYLGVRGLLPLGTSGCGPDNDVDCITGLTGSLGVAGTPRGVGAYATAGSSVFVYYDRPDAAPSTSFEVMLEARWIGGSGEITLTPQLGRFHAPQFD